MHFSSTDRLIARASPAAFAHLVSGGSYVPFDHLIALDQQLTRLASGEIERLIVSMPPRHGKSETISRYLPAWYLGRFPARRVMLASYEAAFAASWGRKARELLEQYGEQLFGVRIAPGAAASSAWELAGHPGGMVTAGVGGALTGKGAHLLIIDDPVKNHEEAHSQLLREKAWDWWRSTARTRLQRPGAVVLVMTRWHEDDLAGRLLRDGSDDWTVLELPALADHHDPLGRAAGQALCPGLGFDEAWLASTRAELGSYWFSALYQQRPGPAEGLLFKRRDFRYWREHPDDELYLLERDDGSLHPTGKDWCTHFQTVDVAASEKHSADYTVVSSWAATPDRELLLIDRERQRFEALDVGGTIERAYRRQARTPAFIGIEEFGYGLAVVQELNRKGLPITAYAQTATRSRAHLSPSPATKNTASITPAGPAGSTSGRQNSWPSPTPPTTTKSTPPPTPPDNSSASARPLPEAPPGSRRSWAASAPSSCKTAARALFRAHRISRRRRRALPRPPESRRVCSSLAPLRLA